MPSKELSDADRHAAQVLHRLGFGGPKTLPKMKLVRCPQCGGREPHQTGCPKCHGDGMVDLLVISTEGAPRAGTEKSLSKSESDFSTLRSVVGMTENEVES
ncbi:hypothetical protein [Zavarzinia sp.]|uniref:hypothetical protein n=1 Tax=Zavarzinia sp. TaxID=2027920 RepID=UPI0035623D66